MKSLSIVLAAALLLALAILFSLLKKKLGLGSFSAVVEEESAAILRRMKGLIAPPQRIDPGLSFIALVTASLAVSVVVFCLPTYSHIAGFTLNFPPLVARRFAYLMLVLVAILGIAFHVFQLVGFGGRDDGKAGARTGSYDWVPQLIIIVLLGMQATFTSILYNAYYSRTSPGNQVLVAGMTTLAFIGTWAESIASYVTFRLGRPLFAWIFTLVMLLPGLVLHFLAQAWQRIFHRKSVQAVSPDLEAGPGSGSTNGHLGHRHAQVLEKIIVAGRKPGKENTK